MSQGDSRTDDLKTVRALLGHDGIALTTYSDLLALRGSSGRLTVGR